MNRLRRRRLLALAISGVVALGVGELGVRVLLPEPRLLGEPYFRAADGTPMEVMAASASALRRGVIEAVPIDQTPRPRYRFAPNAHFFMCYHDAERLDAAWLDRNGCVEVRINRYGLREREEIAPHNKAPDERRLVCIGDSFTFCWGIPEELGWVRRLEHELRRSHGNVRTVNCGLSGALTVDEYETGLRTRFGAFQPDVVVVGIYLNDLIASHGLCIYQQTSASGFRLYDALRGALARDPLDLDPRIDWVERAMNVEEAVGLSMGVYGPDKPFSGMWSQGAPQRALLAMRDWCKDHNALLLVTLWPFLQGLGNARYPFGDIHDQVASYCSDHAIPFLDLLPSLASAEASSLWVTPFDKHANPRAQDLVLPSIADFVRRHLQPR